MFKVIRVISFFVLICACSLPALADDLRSQVEKGVLVSGKQADAHQWHEAFTTLRALDANLGAQHPELHYLVAKQRYKLYYRINKATEVKNNLQQMEALARRSGNKQTIEDMLGVKAGYYLDCGDEHKATQCYRELITRRCEGMDDAGKDKCFQRIIAETKQNPVIASLVERLYTGWKDSIATQKSASELENLKYRFREAQETIDSKSSRINGQWATIVFLLILSLILAAALAFFVFIVIRNVRVTKKLRESLRIANGSNEQKSMFIRNIGNQISPSLDAIEKGINTANHLSALRTMLKHAEEYMVIESSREEMYDTADVSIEAVCSEVAQSAMKETELPIVVDAPKIKFSMNAEAVKRLLSIVLHEVSLYKGTERITLEFKKRNPHTGHFIVTAVGMILSDEEANSIFKAFARVYDLTQTDGLALPTCSVMAYKMGGLLRLDSEFKRGTRFVLELHC